MSGGTGSATVAGGTVSVTLPALSGAVLLTGTVDLEPPAAPSGLATGDVGAGSVALQWNAVDGAAAYAVYRSPVTLGGYVKLGTVAGTSFTDTSVQNGIRSYYVVRALDAAGNESGDSNQVSALPSLPVVWANVQWPPTIDEQLQAAGWTVYGQVYVPGITDAGGSADLISAQLGWGDSTDRAGWQWVDATFNAGSLLRQQLRVHGAVPTVGAGDVLLRLPLLDERRRHLEERRPRRAGHLTRRGAHLAAGRHDGSRDAHWAARRFGRADGDRPRVGANTEPDLFGYEVWRSGTKVGTPTSPSFADTTVVNGTTYTYVVKAVDNAVNVSGASSPVTAKAALRNVSVVFTVTAPAGTPGGSTVHVAGSFGDLDSSYPTWDPAGLPMTQLDATHWTITLSGLESTHVEYKYTLGSWDFVEKGSTCDELGNRVLTVSYGSTGTQNVNDSVANWRAVAPCGS